MKWVISFISHNISKISAVQHNNIVGIFLLFLNISLILKKYNCILITFVTFKFFPYIPPCVFSNSCPLLPIKCYNINIFHKDVSKTCSVCIMTHYMCVSGDARPLQKRGRGYFMNQKSFPKTVSSKNIRSYTREVSPTWLLIMDQTRTANIVMLM